jgi:RNA polymerase sigma factor (sigma-70 family)
MTYRSQASSELPAPAGGVDLGEPGSAAWEHALLTRACGGETAALGTLLRSYQARLFGLVLRYVGRRAEAAEVTQEAFLQAFRSIDRFELGRPFRPWLFQIAVNVCRNHRRLGARRESPSQLDPHAEPVWGSPADQPDKALHDKAEQQGLERLLMALSPEDRALLLLRYTEGLSYEELSRIYGRRPGLLKMRVHRALKRMRELAEGGSR